MEVALVMGIIKGIAIFAGVVGIVAGIDLLFGVRMISSLKKLLEKSIDFDSAFLKMLASLREKLDKPINADKKILETTSKLRDALDKNTVGIDSLIFNTQLRVGLGFLFLILSAIILLLVRLQ